MGKLDKYDRKLQRLKLAEVAYSLLELCDPDEIAIHVSKYGISLYPRCDASKTTPWERNLWEEQRQLPAVWTGYLSRFLGLASAVNGNSSRTSSRSLDKFLTVRPGQRHRHRSSSTTPSLTKPAYPSNGLSRDPEM
jgi:hypothetical protein